MFQVRLAFRGGLAHLHFLWSRSRWFLAEYGTAFTSDQGYLLLLPSLLGIAQFGIYRADFSLIGPVIIILTAGNNIGLPNCVRRLRECGMHGLMAYSPRLIFAVVGLATAYVGLVAILAEPLLRLIYGPGFTGGAYITRLLAVQWLILSVGSCYGVALKATGRIGLLWVMRMVNAIVSISGVVALASSLGLVGACLAGLAGAVIYTFGIFWAYRRMRLRWMTNTVDRTETDRRKEGSESI
jgi:O-antigen/teichoic acid export membrane protein